MTNNMEFVKGVLLMQALRNFDNDYLEWVFGGTINMDAFGNMLLVEFIKRAYCDKAPTYPLRHFVPYSGDDNSTRMLYARIVEYVQKYRDREYGELSRQEGVDQSKLELLKPQQMKTIKQRLKGYKFTDMQFFELTTIHELQIVKAFATKRLPSTKKVSNAQFRDLIKDYEEWVEGLRKKQNGNDDDIVFSALAFFTFEWKFAIELIYQVARQMDVINAKEIDKDALSLLCERLTLSGLIAKNIRCDSRAAKERQFLIPYLIKEPSKQDKRDVGESQRYLEILCLLVLIKIQIPINGQAPDEWFAENTNLEDWASFFKEYNIFECWHSKELTETVVRNMRAVFDMIIKEP